MSTTTLKVIIAGGGTGGHIFPAIAIAQTVRRHHPDADILFVGAKGKMEMEKVPQAGFKIIGLDIVGFNRSNIFKNITLPFRLLKSIQNAKSIIREFNPDIVIGVGGYASFPMLKAAQKLGVPTLIQEQNSRAGKSNIMLAKNAQVICTAYEGMETYFKTSAPIVLTGNPVREQIKALAENNKDDNNPYQLEDDSKVIFIVGGSLGASSINKAIAEHYERLLEDPKVHIYWQTGKNDYQKYTEAFKNNPRIHIFDFIKDIEKIYAVADVIISRAGAMAISELCIVGKTVVFVPYPYAAEDHQTINAQYLVNRDAAYSIPDAHVSTEIVGILNKIILDGEKRQLMAANIKKLAIIDADERIYQQIINVIQK